MSEIITGAEALMRALEAEGVDTTFGYPGGAIIPVFDALYENTHGISNILVRHEQGAVHAAQGYSRVNGRTGVVIVTSGPGATNVTTGISDAMMDSTPLVVITGQVSSEFLGCDAFQESDVIGFTQPLTKWSYQIRTADDIPTAVAKAFYIASSGRPGPVVLDLAKNAQCEKMEWKGYQKCESIRSYTPIPYIDEEAVMDVADLINRSRRPLIIVGHGVMISQAEAELISLAEKADIPVCTTLLGLSVINSSHRLNKGMLGMHGSLSANIATTRCDLLIAIGMRFDDRVTGDTSAFASQAKIVHIDIDASEFDKNIKTYSHIHGDARQVLARLLPRISEADHSDWLKSFEKEDAIEQEKVINPELKGNGTLPTMGMVINKISEATDNEAILVTDVGQNQMMAARYFKFSKSKSIVTSGGLGTMGFGLPAAIGAKIGAKNRTVCLFCGDGGIQMTIEELGVIMQYGINVKIIILNNNFLGMVRQWQELFFNKRFSETPMLNPDFIMIANAYGIKGETVETAADLDSAIKRMLTHDGAYLLNVCIDAQELVYPMIPAGGTMNKVLLSRTEKYEI